MNSLALTFDDVLIKPQFSMLKSRKEVSLSFKRANIPHLELPIISANMDTVTNVSMCHALAKFGAIGCLHRFNDIEENVKEFLNAKVDKKGHTSYPMVSIGISEFEFERAKALFAVGASVFVIDVAHGAQISVVEQARKLRLEFADKASIIVGNFASGESLEIFLEHFSEIDGVKVGVGPGSACTTRVKTGVGVPQIHAIEECVEVCRNRDIFIIADGGIRSAGDVAKSIACGADMVMLGGMLSGTDESPGEVVNGMKKYRGSASSESYKAQGKVAEYFTDEGESFMIPYKGSVDYILRDLAGGLRSSLTYVGAKNIQEYHKNAKFVRITGSGLGESHAHGSK